MYNPLGVIQFVHSVTLFQIMKFVRTHLSTNYGNVKGRNSGSSSSPYISEAQVCAIDAVAWSV